MIKPVTYQGCFNFNANLYALEVRSRFIDQSKANGYYAGYGSELAAQIVGQKIQIGTGAFVVQGRMNEVTAAETVSPQIFDGFVGYIVARIETYHPSDDENCTFKAIVNRTFEAITLEQNDVYAATADNINTAYELPIYSFEISGTQIVNLTKLIKPVADYATIKTIVDDALTKAQQAITTANAAVSTANAANAKATTAETKAASAETKATNAETKAASAETKATNAVSTANAANTKAQEANTIANNAKTAADNAVSAANEANNKADAATTTAAGAVGTAEGATETANAAKASAESAVGTANDANSKSTTAQTEAAEAKQVATDASNLASNTKTQVDKKIAELEQQIGEKQGTTVTVDSVAQSTFEAGGLIAENDTIVIGGGDA